MFELRLHRLERFEAAIDGDGRFGKAPLQRMNQRVIERRHAAVVLWRKSFEPRLAGVHDQRIGAGGEDRLGKDAQRLFRLLIVDADAAFDRHRDGHGGLHRADAIGDKRWLAHEAGAESAILHALGRATDIEIDLVIAEIGRDAGGLRKIGGSEPPSCTRDRMLGGVKAEQARAIAMQQGGGGDHLRIEPGAARERAMEDPAMPVGPFHHRRHAKSKILIL